MGSAAHIVFRIDVFVIENLPFRREVFDKS
jgi:hypothetical protein